MSKIIIMLKTGQGCSIESNRREIGRIRANTNTEIGRRKLRAGVGKVTHAMNLADPEYAAWVRTWRDG